MDVLRPHVLPPRFAAALAGHALALASALGCGSNAAAQSAAGSPGAEPILARFSSAPATAPPAPWRIVTLPKLPRHTRFEIVADNDARVLRVAAEGSYANLLHPLATDLAAAPLLRWRWRVVEFPAGADLRHKAGDDTAARLCVLFELPDERLTVATRWRLRLARTLFDPQLPAASICYVWDATLPAGTWLANAYTDRVRMLVLRSGPSTAWQVERRDLRADFAQAFAAEAGGGFSPRLVGVALAADGDDTGARALSYFGDIELAADVRP